LRSTTTTKNTERLIASSSGGGVSTLLELRGKGESFEQEDEGEVEEDSRLNRTIQQQQQQQLHQTSMPMERNLRVPVIVNAIVLLVFVALTLNAVSKANQGFVALQCDLKNKTFR